jgi:hypothetical protein
MVPKVHLDVRLTLPEARAIARLVKIGIYAMETDEQPVSNAVTLQRAIDACKCGLEKIETAISNVEPAVSRHTRR